MASRSVRKKADFRRNLPISQQRSFSVPMRIRPLCGSSAADVEVQIFDQPTPERPYVDLRRLTHDGKKKILFFHALALLSPVANVDLKVAA